MTDNEIVLNLLEFYKDKGIDLYKVLDDPTFKHLKRETQLRAIQVYAQKILDGTPKVASKKDIRGMLTNALLQTVGGAASGALTGFGLAKAFHGGTVPAEAIVSGAVFGGITGAFGGGIGIMGRLNDRSFMRAHLQDAVDRPSPGTALNVITANHVKGTQGEIFKKLLDKITADAEGHLKTESANQVSHFVDYANEGRPKY